MDEDNHFIPSFLDKLIYKLFDRQLKIPKKFDYLFFFLLQKGKDRGFLSREEAKVISRAFNFGKTTVREIMVPGPEMVCGGVNTSLTQIIHLIISKGHSRLPIYKDNLDNIIGIIHAKDLLRFWGDGEKQKMDLTRFFLPPLFVPETQKISELLKEMNLRHIHLAIVVNEHGSTVGLVTLEDIVEEIFGAIQDEYDRETVKVVQISDNTWRAQAGINLEELEEILQIKFPEGKYETLGGFLTHLTGRVVRAGEVVNFENLEFSIIIASARRIQEVLIKKTPKV